MGKVNPLEIRRRPRQTFTSHFSGGGLEFDITFRRLSAIEFIKALDLATELTERYVDGNDGQPLEFLPAIGGEAVLPSKTTCEVVAVLYTAQSPSDASERYTCEELAVMMVSDEILDAMCAASMKVKELSAPTDDEDPKAPAESGAISRS